MSNHQAVEQMIGYLYQVRYALYLLLESDDEQSQISIEKFDDIAFSKGDSPEKLIQLKHHTKSHGDLSDSSTDIWRTLNVWADIVHKDINNLENTKFIIITTAKAPTSSAASYLKHFINEGERDTNKAFQILKKVSQNSKNLKHSGYYKTFIKLGDNLGERLINNVYVVDGSSNIINVENDIRKAIRYSSLPKYEDKIYERLEGWWYKRSVDYLLSDEPVFISQAQIRSIIVNFSSEYSEDNLPIDIPMLDDIKIEILSSDERIFYEQLKLMCLHNNRINIAIRDYYRAFKQRANWIRDDLLYINELDKYEEHLIDEWERLFYIMQEELEDYDGEITEKIKQKYGKILYNEIQDKDIRIREKCSEAFIMRGSYHSLANRLSVGWHTDFKVRIKELMESGDGRI
ncbi:hypothetical protein H7E67_15345 [Clostridium gasigenes]|uniref:ABC-three component system protein n=1 Tax=Clostridium gasigenes TaxID=94869 RepID=UPI00162A0376|nr:ABC-three component system protein [Clostridium gasigenes]MBB6624815.1 hypothetical protein [Clostridium gasigenes]